MQRDRSTAHAIERQTFSIPETARILGIGLNQAYELVGSDVIESVTIGSRRRPTRAGLEKMLGHKLP